MSNATASPTPRAARLAGSSPAVTREGVVVCEHCVVADTPPKRMRGLLGRDGMEAGEGLLIRPTNAIHMWFMRFAIDAIFLDGDGRVLRIAADLRPWKMAMTRGAKSVLELTAGTCALRGITVGDEIVVADARA